jgi:type IV pilus assembly protein PilQ
VKRHRTAVAAALLLVASAAAAEPRPTRTPPPRSAGVAPRRTAPPPALPPGGVRVLGTEERRYVGEPISLDLKDADIRDVLLTFGKLARLNMVIDPEVKGSVTVRLENVAWDQALDVILRSNGLGYVMEGNVTRIGQPGKLQRGP